MYNTCWLKGNIGSSETSKDSFTQTGENMAIFLHHIPSLSVLARRARVPT